MARPLRAVYANTTYSTGVQEMSDSDIGSVIAPVILTYIVNNPSTTYGTTLRVNSAGTYDISRGSTVDTRNASIGTHPSSNSTISTYTVYQNERVVSPLGVTARPVHYVASGSENRIVEMTDAEIYTWIAPSITQTMIAGGQGGYYLGLTSSGAPATGTWVSYATLYDTYYNASNVLTTDSYTLWQRTTGTSAGTVRPLKMNGSSGLVEMTDAEIQSLAACIGEYIRNTGIGQYAFQVSAPGTGTWSSRGAFTDTVNNLVDTGYASAFAGNYATAYTGTFVGTYASTFTTAYNRNYTGAFTRIRDQVFSGSYTNTYTTVYAGSYNSLYVGNYASSYTQVYVGNYTAGASYTGGSPAKPYTTGASYSGTISLASFVGYYSRDVATYSATYSRPTRSATVYYSYEAGSYVGNYAGPSTTVFYRGWAGVAFYQATYTATIVFVGTAYYISNFTSSYSRTVAYSRTRILTSETFFSAVYTGAYNSSYTQIYTGSYSSTYVGNYTNTFTQTYVGAYTGSFTGTYSSIFTSPYFPSFTGSFSGIYTGSYTTVYTGSYTHAFSGLTVQAATSTTTTTLWVRTA